MPKETSEHRKTYLKEWASLNKEKIFPYDLNFMDYAYSSFYFNFGLDLAMLWSDIRRSFQRFLRLLAPVQKAPNPLPILMRALNAVRSRFVIKQPCWRANRWRSLT